MPSFVIPNVTIGKWSISAPPSIAQPAMRLAIKQYSDWIQWADAQSRYEATDQGTYRSMYTQSSAVQQALSSAVTNAGTWEKRLLFPAVSKITEVSDELVSELSRTLLEHARLMSNVGACWNPVEQDWQMVRPVYDYDVLRFQDASLPIAGYNAELLSHILQPSKALIGHKFGVEIPASMHGVYGKVLPSRWKELSVMSYVSSVICPVILALRSTCGEIVNALTFKEVQELLSSACSAEMRVYQWSPRAQLAGAKQIQIRVRGDSTPIKTQDAVFSYFSAIQSKRSDKPQVVKWVDEHTGQWATDLSQSGPCLIKTGRGGHSHVLPIAVLVMSQTASVVVSKWLSM
jgi:hypothetical protein